MATSSVSGAGRTSGVSPLQRGGNAPAQQILQADDGAPKEKKAATSAPPRQFVNIDGNTFDRTAPRGSYVNIVV